MLLCSLFVSRPLNKLWAAPRPLQERQVTAVTSFPDATCLSPKEALRHSLCLSLHSVTQLEAGTSEGPPGSMEPQEPGVTVTLKATIPVTLAPRHWPQLDRWFCHKASPSDSLGTDNPRLSLLWSVFSCCDKMPEPRPCVKNTGLPRSQFGCSEVQRQGTRISWRGEAQQVCHLQSLFFLQGH
jgi:hypothetical protein